MPAFPELSVKKMYLALKEDPAIKAFLLYYPKGQYSDQEFFHKLVWSLYPAQIFDIISNAMKSRSVNAKQKDEDKIEMTNEMVKEIIECVSLPSTHPVLFEHFHRQAREGYSLTEEESKEC